MSCQGTVAELASVLQAEILSHKKSSFCGVGTDSRKNLQNHLFIALKGPRFDGHDFLQEAVQKGACILLVDQVPDLMKYLDQKVSILKVKNTLKALQILAQFWRKKVTAQIVAITGSVGKTSTKNFSAQILSQYFKTYVSPASYNNHIGVPLSLLEISLEDEVAILEVGMNCSGEIKKLCKIICPDVVLVTLVGQAHVGYFNSVDEIAFEKEQMYLTHPQAVSIFNGDNKYTQKMWQKYLSQKIIGK